MRDRYIEVFVSDAITADRELDILHEDYRETGVYPVAGGFLVFADRDSDRGL